LDEFPAYVEGQALAAISLQASADAEVSVERVRAKVAVKSARVALSDAKRKHLQKLADPPDVVLIDGGAPLNPAQARKLAAVMATLATTLPTSASASASNRAGAGPGAHLDTAARTAASQPPGVILLVDAPRNLWVSGKDANIELGLEPGFRVEITDAPRVYGQVTIKRGRVEVVGRRFDLKAESTIRFVGPPDAPELDVSAKHVNDKESITVLVTVSGSPGRLQIGISAPDRPDLTETQLYTLIVTGRLDLGGGTASSSTPADRAASLVGGLMAAQLQKTLAKKLPVDVLRIEAGNGLGVARLEAGRYVRPDLYVGYVARPGADPALLQNRNAVHMEYELGSRWSFQGEYGDAKTGSADVIWTKRY
jgi:translocation and assembly module TamB